MNALTTKELKEVKEMLAAFPMVMDAVEIAKDELMRVKYQEHFHDDASDFSLENRPSNVLARAISRKFYKHHGELKKYPWKYTEMLSLTKQQMTDFFKTVEDPEPDSETFRTAKT